eukprot:Hpha_TRINITY_DN13030_c0_g2::TRINITY_DN13030_c0_g2_i1::g.68922::m.68922
MPAIPGTAEAEGIQLPSATLPGATLPTADEDNYPQDPMTLAAVGMGYELKTTGRFFRGKVVSYDPQKEIGYLKCPEAEADLGSDPFVRKDELGHFTIGDDVFFEAAQRGGGAKPQATNLQDAGGPNSDAAMRKYAQDALESERLASDPAAAEAARKFAEAEAVRVAAEAEAMRPIAPVTDEGEAGEAPEPGPMPEEGAATEEAPQDWLLAESRSVPMELAGPAHEDADKTDAADAAQQAPDTLEDFQATIKRKREEEQATDLPAWMMTPHAIAAAKARAEGRAINTRTYEAPGVVACRRTPLMTKFPKRETEDHTTFASSQGRGMVGGIGTPMINGMVMPTGMWGRGMGAVGAAWSNAVTAAARGGGQLPLHAAAGRGLASGLVSGRGPPAVGFTSAGFQNPGVMQYPPAQFQTQ